MPDGKRLGSGRLGTGRLGTASSYDQADLAPELADIVSPQGPASSRARLDDHMKPAFDFDKDHSGDDKTNWDHLLDTLATEFEEWATARDITHVEAFIDTATGERLNKLGRLAGVSRETDESDAHFRMRIKLRFHALVRGPTVERIKRSSALVLGISPAEVGLEEPSETEPARFDLTIPEPALDETDISGAEFQDLLTNIKPAGVRVLATLGGMFTHRSERDFLLDVNDPEKGYDGLDENGVPMDIGGEYAGLLFDTTTDTTLL